MKQQSVKHNFIIENVPIKLSNQEVIQRSFSFSHITHGDPAKDKIYQAVQLLQKLSISDKGNRIYENYAVDKVSRIFSEILIPHFMSQNNGNIISQMFPDASEMFVETYKAAGLTPTNVRSGQYPIVGDPRIKMDHRLASGVANFKALHNTPNLEFYYFIDRSQTPPVCYVNSMVSLHYKIDFDGDHAFLTFFDGVKQIEIKGKEIAGAEAEQMQEIVSKSLFYKYPNHSRFGATPEDTNFNPLGLVEFFKGPKSIVSGLNYTNNQDERFKALEKNTTFKSKTAEEFRETLQGSMVPDRIGQAENRLYALHMYNTLVDFQKFIQNPEIKQLVHQGITEKELRTLFSRLNGRGEIPTAAGMISLLRTNAMGDLEGPLAGSGALQTLLEQVIKQVSRGKVGTKGVEIKDLVHAVDPNSEFARGFSPKYSLNNTIKIFDQLVAQGHTFDHIAQELLTPQLKDLIVKGIKERKLKNTPDLPSHGDPLNIYQKLKSHGLIESYSFSGDEAFSQRTVGKQASVITIKRVDQEGNIVTKILNQSIPGSFAETQKLTGSVLNSVGRMNKDGEVEFLQGEDYIAERLDELFQGNKLQEISIHDRQLKTKKTPGFRLPGQAEGEMSKQFLLSDAIGAPEARIRLAKANNMDVQKLISILKNDNSGNQLKNLVLLHDNQFHGAQTRTLRRALEDLASLAGSQHSISMASGSPFLSKRTVEETLSQVSLVTNTFVNGERRTALNTEDQIGFIEAAQAALQSLGLDLKGKPKGKKNKKDLLMEGVWGMKMGRVGENVANDPLSLANEDRAAAIASQMQKSTEVKGITTAYVDLDLNKILQRHGVSNPAEFIENNIMGENGLGNASAGIGIMSDEFEGLYRGTKSDQAIYNSFMSTKLVDPTRKIQYSRPGITAALRVGDEYHPVHLIEGIGEAVGSRSAGLEISRQQAAYSESVGIPGMTRELEALQRNPMTEELLEQFHEKASKDMELLIFHNNEVIARVNNPIVTQTSVNVSERPLGDLGEKSGPGINRSPNAKIHEQTQSDLLIRLVNEDGLDPLEASRLITKVERNLTGANPMVNEAHSLWLRLGDLTDPTAMNQQASRSFSQLMENSKAVRKGALTALEDLSKIRL